MSSSAAGDLLFVGSFIILIVTFVLWGNRRIKESRKEVLAKFAAFENTLVYALSEYQAYTNNHPYVWGEIKYSERYDEIVSSAEWSRTTTSAWPTKAMHFCLRVDEKRKAIYIPIGYKSFDWSSLHHYKEWLESMSDVNKAIKKHKESTFPA